MNLKILGLTLLLTSFLVSFNTTAEGREPPIAKLVQVEGDVEYSRNGHTWNPVRRTKYLFPGYQIRTGEDGGGKLINQESGMSQELGSNSLVEIKDDEIALVSGSLSKPEEESISIWQSLANKFARAQRYTTVRRGTNTSDEQVCDNKVRTIRKVALSPSYPELVWRNACPEYSYRLVIEGEVHDIPAQSTAEMIRYEVEGLEPGEYSYHVEVLDKDGTVYIPRRESTLIWMSEGEEQQVLSQVKEYKDDIFVKTHLLEENELHVAAMDEFREYFQENPDDNDMRPLLIQSYQNLKLDNLRESEARLYNASLVEDY